MPGAAHRIAEHSRRGRVSDDLLGIRVEAELPVEVSQGNATIRIYSEYRMGEGGETLTLIELRSSRNNPLVYRFRRLPADDTSRP